MSDVFAVDPKELDVFFPEIRQHFLEEYPFEGVGAILGDKYVRLTNVSTDRRNRVEVLNSEITPMVVSGRLRAVVHSHPDHGAWPSLDDMKSQISMGIPHGIVSVERGKTVSRPVWFGDQIKYPPLKGREFVHGVTDCYSLIRHWYYETWGLLIIDKPRDYEWWNKPDLTPNNNLYEHFLAEAGFVEVKLDDIQFGDGMLFRIASFTNSKAKINHGSIYTGNNLMIHQFLGLASKEEPVGRWLHRCCKVVRHSSRL